MVAAFGFYETVTIAPQSKSFQNRNAWMRPRCIAPTSGKISYNFSLVGLFLFAIQRLHNKKNAGSNFVAETQARAS